MSIRLRKKKIKHMYRDVYSPLILVYVFYRPRSDESGKAAEKRHEKSFKERTRRKQSSNVYVYKCFFSCVSFCDSARPRKRDGNCALPHNGRTFYRDRVNAGVE